MSTLHFGPYRFDPLRRLLWRGAAPVALTPKAFEVLAVLVERRGELVDKEALLARVWPDAVVEENNLPRQISTLRKILQEHPGQHEYIVTVPGRGYRFVAPVVEVDEEPDAPVVPATRAFPVRWAAPVAALAVAGLVAATLRPDVRGREPESTARTLSRLTYEPGLQDEPAWSPQGDRVAYTSYRSGSADIWVQDLAGRAAIQLTSSEAHDWQPDWSADGRMIAFRSEREGGGLYVVSVDGGTPRRIATFGFRPRWSGDGSRILFSSSGLQDVTETPRFYVVEENGGTPRVIAHPALDGTTALEAAWHPDRRRVSLLARGRDGATTFLTIVPGGGAAVVSSIAEPVRTRLAEAGVTLSRFVWAPSGRHLYFEGTAHEVTNIWRVTVDPATLAWIGGPDRLTTGPGHDRHLALSSDGRTLAFSSQRGDTRLWTFPFDSASGRLAAGGEALTPDGSDASFPDAPATIDKVVYRTTRKHRNELWERSFEAGQERLLLAADNFLPISPRWSRDGSRLVYRRGLPDTADAHLVLLAADGGTAQLTTPGAMRWVPYDWSRDGAWLLGACAERSQPFAICLLPVDAAPHAEQRTRRIASSDTRNLWQARFSPDDRWISFTAIDAAEAGVSTLYVVPARGGAWTPLSDGRSFDDKLRWLPDSSTVYFVSNRTGFFNVWGRHFDLASGVPAGEAFKVTAFDSPRQMISPSIRQMEMAVTSTRIVLPITQVSGEIWILENVDR